MRGSHQFLARIPRKDTTPGPGAYESDRIVRRASSQKNGRTQKSEREQERKANQQKLEQLKKLQERHEQIERDNAPEYQQLRSTVGVAPKFTFHQRPQIKDGVTIPGPNYVPPHFGTAAEKHSIGVRSSLERNKSAPTPSPADYSVPLCFGYVTENKDEGDKKKQKTAMYISPANIRSRNQISFTWTSSVFSK